MKVIYTSENKWNYINYNGEKLLKKDVDNCFIFIDGFSFIEIDKVLYYIDEECNFYNEYEISFKELYNKYPNKRQELIEIIDKYTYHDTKEYFI